MRRRSTASGVRQVMPMRTRGEGFAGKGRGVSAKIAPVRSGSRAAALSESDLAKLHEHRFNCLDSITMQRELRVELGFVQRRLPWLIAAGAFLIYLVTLNHSSTFAGVSSLSKAAGWDWRSNVVAPLHVLLTLPIRWLPTGIQLFALNLLAAASASMALGLLARAVELFVHVGTSRLLGLAGMRRH